MQIMYCLGTRYSEPGQVQISFDHFRIGLFTAYRGVWLRKYGIQTHATVPMLNPCPPQKSRPKILAL